MLLSRSSCRLTERGTWWGHRLSRQQGCTSSQRLSSVTLRSGQLPWHRWQPWCAAAHRCSPQVTSSPALSLCALHCNATCFDSAVTVVGGSYHDPQVDKYCISSCLLDVFVYIVSLCRAIENRILSSVHEKALYCEIRIFPGLVYLLSFMPGSGAQQLVILRCYAKPSEVGPAMCSYILLTYVLHNKHDHSKA